MKSPPFTNFGRAICLCLATVIPLQAITITYKNIGPTDSRVFVGFDNNSSGYTTSDFVTALAAASRNDTAYGPLPPPGDLPNFDAKTYAAAELGTNLNAPLGLGVRSAFAPLNLTFFQAHGETLAATGAYSSHAYAHSGDTTSTVPMRWLVHVDPSGAEVAGALADVTITGSLSGSVTATGASIASATWNVATTLYGTVMTGIADQLVPGSTGFSDSGTITFTVPLGSTFELIVDYDLTASGAGAGANSTSEMAASLVQISAVLQPLAPPLVVFVGPAQKIWPPFGQLVKLKSTFSIPNPNNLGYTLTTRVFSNENEFWQNTLTDNLRVRAWRNPHGDGRFYIILLSIAQTNGVKTNTVLFGGYVPKKNTAASIAALSAEATNAVLALQAALLTTPVGNLNPADFGLYEYGW